MFFIFPFSSVPWTLRASEKVVLPTVGRRKRMNTQLPLEEKHDILKNKLLDNMKRKQVLELEITKQYEQLKRIETSMEKNSHGL
jgi:hypothetical protein